MRTTTRILHETLIRLAKGMIKAWEEWLRRTVDEDEKSDASRRK